MAKQTDTSWNTEKLEQVAAVLREADQILVGIGGGFNLAAGVEELPLDKKLNENSCKFQNERSYFSRCKSCKTT